MKDCLHRLTVMVVAAVTTCSAFALDTAYWLPASTVWGDFGTAENWAIGSAESEVHAVPTMDNTIDMTTAHKFDLGGSTFSVGGTVGPSGARLLSVTNGTLNLTGSIYHQTDFEVCSNATVRVTGNTARYWGATCWSDTITVRSGGRYEELGKLQFQGYRGTIEKDATFVHNPTSYGPHPGAISAQDFKNYGRYEAPNGLYRFKEWDTTYAKPAGGSVTHFHYDGSTFLIGGKVARQTQNQIPFNLRFYSCTLIASNTVTFASDMDLVKIEDNASLTAEVVKDATLDLANVTIGENVTVTKTGAGKLILADVAIPTLAVEAGSVELNAGASLPTSYSFASGAKLILNVKDVTLNPTAYDGMTFEINSSLFVVGNTLIRSDDADFLAYAKTAINETMPAGYGVVIIGQTLVYAKSSAYVFDPSKASDLSDPAGWNGEMPTADNDVIVSGNGTGTAYFNAETPHFKSIAVQLGATLAVTGGTEAAAVDLPAVELDYNARLLIAEDAVVQMTNVFTTVGDATQLPILEVATNALLIAQTPDLPIAYNWDNQWSYHTPDYGFGLKNVSLKWYGTIKMFHPDVADDGSTETSHLSLGYASYGETSYIAVDCQGGTYYRSGEGNSGARCRTGLMIAVPLNGKRPGQTTLAAGTVVPVGTLRFRDYKVLAQASSSANPEYAAPGLFIGKCSPYYTGNPDSIEYDVVFEGDTALELSGGYRIAGGAHVYLKSPATWSYTRKAWSDEGLVRSVTLSEKATLSVDGTYLDICSCDESRGLNANGTVEDQVTFTAKDARLSMLNWSGSGLNLAKIDNSLLELGYLRSDKTLGKIAPVFDGFKSVELTNPLVIAAADVDRGNASKDAVKKIENWDRWVKVGPPLTGTGSLIVSNELAGAHTIYTSTVVVTNGANTATGVAAAAETATGAKALLMFADGANWAGTVQANDNVGLTNLVEDAAAATANFNALEGTMPIRVWKTGGAITANDKVNLATAGGAFKLVAMDEALKVGDVVELGLYPEGAALPTDSSYMQYSSEASSTAGFVTLKAKCVRPGLVIIVR